MKTLAEQAKSVYIRLEDQCIHLYEDISSDYKGDRYYHKRLDEFKEAMADYLGEISKAKVPDEYQGDECKISEFRRRQILTLGGISLKSLLSLRGQDGGEEDLRKVAELARSNMESVHRTADDLQIYLSASLTRYFMHPASYISEIKYDEVRIHLWLLFGQADRHAICLNSYTSGRVIVLSPLYAVFLQVIFSFMCYWQAFLSRSAKNYHSEEECILRQKCFHLHKTNTIVFTTISTIK